MTERGPGSEPGAERPDASRGELPSASEGTLAKTIPDADSDGARALVAAAAQGAVKLTSRHPPPAPPPPVTRSKPPPSAAEQEAVTMRRPLPPPRTRREEGEGAADMTGPHQALVVPETEDDDEDQRITMLPEEEIDAIEEVAGEPADETEIDLGELDTRGSPPGIPSLAESSSEEHHDATSGPSSRKRKSSKRRLRRTSTLRIPVDDVPATPGPPDVAPVIGALDGDPLHVSTLRPPGAAAAPAPLSASAPVAVVLPKPTPPPVSSGAVPSVRPLPEPAAKSPPAPPVEPKTPPPAAPVEAQPSAPELAAEGASEGETAVEIEPEPLTPPTPTELPEAQPLAGAAEPAAADQEPSASPPSSEVPTPVTLPRPPSSVRPPAPSPSSVRADDRSVGLILPVDVSSDLPPVEGKKRPPRPVPPRRTDVSEPDVPAAETLAIEAADVVPALAAEDAEAPEGGPSVRPAASRRPLPPRRPRAPGEDAIEVDVEEERAAREEAPPPLSPATPPVESIDEPAPAPAAAEAAAEAKAAPKPAPKRKKPWWAELFEEDFLRTLDVPAEADVRREADFIERLLNLARGARVLDLGCGIGRHAVELAQRGYQVVGVDLSTVMLARAAEHAQQRGQIVNFIRGDMRKLSLDAVFDGIYCWSETFGYFDEPTNTAVLESIFRALRSGGTLALDVANRDFIAPRSPTMAWFEQNGCVCMDEMKFDFFTSRMIVKRTVLFDTGRSREIEYSMRLYSLHELGRMLHQTGFRVLEVSGHRAHPGVYFGSESPRIIIAAERS